MFISNCLYYFDPFIIYVTISQSQAQRAAVATSIYPIKNNRCLLLWKKRKRHTKKTRKSDNNKPHKKQLFHGFAAKQIVWKRTRRSAEYTHSPFGTRVRGETSLSVTSAGHCTSFRLQIQIKAFKSAFRSLIRTRPLTKCQYKTTWNPFQYIFSNGKYVYSVRKYLMFLFFT